MTVANYEQNSHKILLFCSKKSSDVTDKKEIVTTRPFQNKTPSTAGLSFQDAINLKKVGNETYN